MIEAALSGKDALSSGSSQPAVITLGPGDFPCFPGSTTCALTVGNGLPSTRAEKFAIAHSVIVHLSSRLATHQDTTISNFEDLTNALNSGDLPFGLVCWILIASSFYEFPRVLQDASGGVSLDSKGSPISSPWASWLKVQITVRTPWQRFAQGTTATIPHGDLALAYAAFSRASTLLRNSGRVADTRRFAGNTLEMVALLARPIFTLLDQPYQFSFKEQGPGEIAKAVWKNPPKTIGPVEAQITLFKMKGEDLRSSKIPELLAQKWTGVLMDPLGIMVNADRVVFDVARARSSGDPGTLERAHKALKVFSQIPEKDYYQKWAAAQTDALRQDKKALAAAWADKRKELLDADQVLSE